MRLDRGGGVCYNKGREPAGKHSRISPERKGTRMENNNSRLASILAYLTIIGWVIAYFIRDKEDAGVRQHLNQAIVAASGEIIGGILVAIPIIGIIGMIVQIAAWVLAIWGLIRAIKGNNDPLPYIGGISIVK